MRGVVGRPAVRLQRRALPGRGGDALAAARPAPRRSTSAARRTPRWPGGRAEHVDVYLTWGEPPEQVAEKIEWMRELAAERGPRAAVRHPAARHRPRHRRRGVGARASGCSTPWTPRRSRAAQEVLGRSESVGQRGCAPCTAARGRRPAGDLARTCGRASAWYAAARARRWSAATPRSPSGSRSTHALGIDEFVLSGYPHLEEAYWFGEGVLPELERRGALAPPVR